MVQATTPSTDSGKSEQNSMCAIIPGLWGALVGLLVILVVLTAIALTPGEQADFMVALEGLIPVFYVARSKRFV